MEPYTVHRAQIIVRDNTIIKMLPDGGVENVVVDRRLRRVGCLLRTGLNELGGGGVAGAVLLCVLRFPMCVEIGSHSETPPARGASVRFLARVHWQVHSQIPHDFERFPAVRAHMLPGNGVHVQLVTAASWTRSETLTALSARVRTLARMAPCVRRHRRSRSERHFTNAAAELFDPAVRVRVNSQGLLRLHCFTTNVAHVRTIFIVPCSHMGCQVAFGWETSAADLAREPVRVGRVCAWFVGFQMRSHFVPLAA